jgi:hypothetical protein
MDLFSLAEMHAGVISRAAWFNFSDVSNIDQRRDREGFMLALSPHRLRLRRGRSPCCKSGARAYHSEFMGSRPRCPLSKQERALQLRPDTAISHLSFIHSGASTLPAETMLDGRTQGPIHRDPQDTRRWCHLKARSIALLADKDLLRRR